MGFSARGVWGLGVEGFGVLNFCGCRRMVACQGMGGGYGLGAREDDAVFKENTGDELGAGARDVWASDFWCVYD